MEQPLYGIEVKDLPDRLKSRITVVLDWDALNRRIACEFADLLEEREGQGSCLTIIAPVGPLDYRYFVDEAQRRGLSCRRLRTINMDEYLDDAGEWLSTSHPLSFRKYMEDTFFGLLPESDRPESENIYFPDPSDPGGITKLVTEIGGADVCWGGLGISGHFAFNDPPAMLGEPDDLNSFRQCRTREVAISPMSTAQMAMGGTFGNLDILPAKAMTLGMYELLKSRKIHMTFMRNWHAGLWRRAFLGPVTQDFPGSLLQEHPNLEITMTELAARPPTVHTAQATGEDADPE